MALIVTAMYYAPEALLYRCSKLFYVIDVFHLTGSWSTWLLVTGKASGFNITSKFVMNHLLCVPENLCVQGLVMQFAFCHELIISSDREWDQKKIECFTLGALSIGI